MTPKGKMKFDKLVEAASNLFYEIGVTEATLDKIANAANVPLGNIYYYFKTKDSIIVAVLNKLKIELESRLKVIDELPSASMRLSALAIEQIVNFNKISQSGDIIASLCLDLSKINIESEISPNILFDVMINWAQEQFVALGAQDAKSKAINFIMSIQGIAMISLATKNSKIVNGLAMDLLNNIK